ncbi:MULTISPECIES: hypothetical protein [Arthrobacter]|uniref:Uncharacterized protein n=1 Tax=Arthrobacter terricola TaxID=2547396 RepID=A0A4V2ZTZ7_9MICC|nr:MULTISPECIES: hypothetical protein [Arthrobacter]MBT8159884.1 hypothetical protein [Arthrobacter sp. GN70]TDF99034.1 hypothetical protein E1809_05490 [Arthrobacter terricola]
MENTQAALDAIEFRVSYLDPHSEHVMEEQFGNLAAAERFANAQLKDADSWAIVDAVAVETAVSGSTPGRTQQLVA